MEAGASGSDDSGEDDAYDSEIDEAAEVAAVKYRYAARRVEKAFPEHEFYGIPRFAGGATWTLDLADEENSRPCVCGNGRAGHWPWQFQAASHGFCDNGCRALCNERYAWVESSLGPDAAQATGWDA